MDWIRTHAWKLMVVTVITAACITGLTLGRPADASVAMRIAYINVGAVVDNHPKMPDVMRQVSQFQRTRVDEVRKKFGDSNEKIDLNSEEGKRLMDETSRALAEVEEFKAKLIEDLVKDVKDAAGRLGKEAGVEIILASDVVLWGGLDLTPAMNSEMNRQYR